MSDGDNATPGHRRASDGDSERVARSPRPSFSPPPWERGTPPRHAGPADEPSPIDEPAGHRTDDGGLSVADLIAKITGDEPADIALTRHRLEQPVVPKTSPSRGPTASDWDDEITASIPTAYASELPDLAEVARMRRAAAAQSPAEQTTVLPPAAAEETTVLPLVPAAPLKRERPTRVGRSDTVASASATRTKRPHRPMMVVGRVASALIAVLALALTGGAWQWSASKNNLLNRVAALDPESRDIVDPNAQFGDENFLIVGVDTRAGGNSEVGAGGTEDAGGARSDTVMLVNIAADRKRVVAVSFPRDLAITPMLCDTWNAETGEYGPIYDEETGSYSDDEVYTETKLNSAYSFGGPKCLVKLIQKISGLSINRFMAVDFAGFSKMVDALGGVEVCSTTPLEDYELGTVLPDAGRQMVDGHTALNYVRARQVTTEINGDYGRIKRQQLFLSSLLRSLISKDTFFSLTKLNNVVNMFINDSSVDNIDTKDLVDLGQSIQGVSAGKITFVTVPTGETDSEGNETPRTDDIRALFDAIIDDDPLPGEEGTSETPEPTTTSSTPGSTTSTEAPTAGEQVDAVTTSPEDVSVHVTNATGETGLAATAASELQQHGFLVDSPDDYPSTMTSTTVQFSPGNEQAAATVAASFNNPSLERVTGLGQVVRVVLGPDFYTVNPPPPSGSPVSVRVNQGTSGLQTQLPEDLTVTNAADTTCE